MPTHDFQTAKYEMDSTLKRLRPEIEGDNIWGVKVPLNHPYLFAQGRNSLVFRLPKSGLAGKSSFYDTVPEEKDPDHKGYYMLAGKPSGLAEGSLEETIKSLRSMGFVGRAGLSLPEMQEHGCKVNLYHPKIVHYTLMPDLREGGRYQLQDAEDFDFGSHPSGKNLRVLYDEWCKEILLACRSGSYKLRCSGHGSEEDPEPAVKRMFLVQFNAEQGNLCISDLNHLSIEKK